MPEPSRKSFLSDAPAMRAALTAELSACLAREDGCLYLPALAILWGEKASYIPPVALPGERVRVAAKILRRRGVLAFSGDGVVVAAEAIRALAG